MKNSPTNFWLCHAKSHSLWPGESLWAKQEKMNKREGDMLNYYAQRASEYERVYAKPEHQSDLQSIGLFLKGAFADKITGNFGYHPY